MENCCLLRGMPPLVSSLRTSCRPSTRMMPCWLSLGRSRFALLSISRPTMSVLPFQDATYSAVSPSSSPYGFTFISVPELHRGALMSARPTRTVQRAIVLALVADASALKLYAQMKNQWPRPRWPCECCGGELQLCWGDVVRPYLRHVAGSNCAGGGEGVLHRLAKDGLADHLETGERVTFTDGRRCSG